MKNENVEVIIPQVGMGVTELMYSDRNVYTITVVDVNGRWFKCQEDRSAKDEENSDKEWPFRKQVYRYYRNHTAPEIKVTLRKDGEWRKVGVTTAGSTRTSYFVLNHRSKFFDYTF
jgi:hypothetical protein